MIPVWVVVLTVSACNQVYDLKPAIFMYAVILISRQEMVNAA